MTDEPQKLPASKNAFFISKEPLVQVIRGQTCVDDYPPEYRYEIERVDIHGRGIAHVRFRLSDTEIEIDGKKVPTAVVEACKRLTQDGGYFVDRNGEEIKDLSRLRNN